MKYRILTSRATIAILFAFVVLAAAYLIPLTVKAYQESLLVDGYEFQVDGQPWFIVDDKEQLNTILEDYKATYLQYTDVDSEILSLDFVQNVDIVDVRVSDEVFAAYSEVEAQIQAIEKEAVYYTVVRGDNLWDIAEKNKIALSKLIQMNPQLDPEKIWAGNQILFEPTDPMLDVLISMKTVVQESIPFTTEYVKDNGLYKNQRTVTKKGVEGSKEVTYQIQFLNGYKDDITILNEVEISSPVGAVVKIGTKPTLIRVSGSNYGVVSGTLSSNYGNRIDPISGRRAFHDGIDIAANYGTPVYSYADGTVVAAGWNNTRGYYVTISHANGIQTNYLHLSKYSVKKGQKVGVGENIGQVGSTGYSTGNHLHFSVQKNGKTVSPWDYL